MMLAQVIVTWHLLCHIDTSCVIYSYLLCPVYTSYCVMYPKCHIDTNNCVGYSYCDILTQYIVSFLLIISIMFVDARSCVDST